MSLNGVYEQARLLLPRVLLSRSKQHALEQLKRIDEFASNLSIILKTSHLPNEDSAKDVPGTSRQCDVVLAQGLHHCCRTL